MQDQEHRYQKLGGWLLTIVIFTFIGAFGVVINLFSEEGFLRSASGYAGARLWMELLIQICMLYEGTARVVFAVMIIRRDPRFGGVWQMKFIGNMLRMLTQLVMHVSNVDPYPPRLFGTLDATFSFGLFSDLLNLGFIVLFVALVALYIRRSVRVRTYMGTNKYLRTMIFTKNDEGPVPMVPDQAQDGEQ